jgi:hypothetical protein
LVCEELREAVRAGGMFARDRPVVALISGGRDSTSRSPCAGRGR